MTGFIAVPVYNEAENIERVIADLLSHFPADKLLFIDDGSSDGSHLLLEAAGVPYLRHPINLGYEETLRTAMNCVLAERRDYVVFFDGDGQHRLEDLIKIIESYEANPCDLVIGSRYRDAEHSGFSARFLGTTMFSKLTTTLAGVQITDVTNGLKLFSRRIIPVALKLPTEDMHAELIVGLARCGAKIREVGITVLPREAGESMYHLTKGLLYPAKTFICLLAELIFYKKLRDELARSDAAERGAK